MVGQRIGRTGWGYGPYDEDPTAQAASVRTQQQADLSPIQAQNRTANSPSSSRQGTSQRRNPGLPGSGGNGTSAGTVDPNSYGADFISGSDEWYGALNQYGAQVAGASPTGFWAGYGGTQGWEPGGNAGAFMASAFDPRAMGAAMYGSDQFTSLEEVLGGSTGIANALVGDGSHAQFVDPSAIAGSIVKALGSGNAKDLQNVNPILAQIINSNVGNPIGQIDSLITFLGSALKGSMPQDVLQAYMSTIERLGSVFASQMMSGDIKKMDVASFVGFLSQQLGPTLGL